MPVCHLFQLSFMMSQLMLGVPKMLSKFLCIVINPNAYDNLAIYKSFLGTSGELSVKEKPQVYWATLTKK